MLLANIGYLSSNKTCILYMRQKKLKINKPWRRVRASRNGHTHLQVRWYRGQSGSSSGGGFGAECQLQVPGSVAGGGRGLLTRGLGTVSAGGGRHRGISLLLLHLEGGRTQVERPERGNNHYNKSHPAVHGAKCYDP